MNDAAWLGFQIGLVVGLLGAGLYLGWAHWQAERAYRRSLALLRERARRERER